MKTRIIILKTCSQCKRKGRCTFHTCPYERVEISSEVLKTVYNCPLEHSTTIMKGVQDNEQKRTR